MTLEAPTQQAAARTPRLRTLLPKNGSGLFGGRLAVVVIGLGLLVLGLGWFGISGEGAKIDGATDVRAQLPYLISGGFLGLGLIVIGACLLVAHATRLERARQEALWEARFDELSAAVLGTAPLRAAQEGLVVSGGAAYHRPDCRLVDGREGQDYVTVDVAEDNGLRACRICRA